MFFSVRANKYLASRAVGYYLGSELSLRHNDRNIPQMEMRTTFFIASSDDVGERLDRVVAAHCPELSRTRAQELIEAGLVLVEGKTAKGSSKVHDGQRISVEEQ